MHTIYRQIIYTYIQEYLNYYSLCSLASVEINTKVRFYEKRLLFQPICSSETYEEPSRLYAEALMQLLPENFSRISTINQKNLQKMA